MLTFATSGHAQPSDEKQKTYQLGVFSYKGDVRTYNEFSPMVALLNKHLIHERIELQVLSQADIYKGIENQTLDFVMTNPTHFLLARHKYQVSGALATLVRNHQGKPLQSLGGVIVARADNHEVNSLTDIQGKNIAAPGDEFMGGYRAQAYELYLAGVDLPKDVNRILFTGSHRATVESVLNKQAAVGFIRDGLLEQMQHSGQLDGSELKVINVQYRSDFPHVVSTRLYPEWPVFALSHVSEKAKRHITSALLSLEFEELVIGQDMIYGFSVPADYLSVESLSRTLRVPPFEQREAITWVDLKAQYGLAIAWVVSLAMALILALILLAIWFKKVRTAGLYSNELLASQEQIVLINSGDELVDVSGGFYTFFAGYFESLAAFKQEHKCICELFVLREGYLFNHPNQSWITALMNTAQPEHKAIVSFNGKLTFFKVNAVFSNRLGLYLITMVDITELEISNQCLAEQTHLAGQANKAKSDFLANMSHEIRTPMNGIIGLSELALKEQDVVGLHKRLQKIHYSGCLLLGIINDILDISKIEAGRLSLELHAFSVTDLVNDLMGVYRLGAHEKRIEFLAEIDPSVAKGYAADDLRLRQILTNLLGNAIKFTQRGTVILRIKMASDADINASNAADNESKVWLKFEIQDTGRGISLEQQKRLFKPFSQADGSITREYGGTGLGLVISDKLVCLMGGDGIQLKSELGHGSLFYFCVPFQMLNAKEMQQLASNTKPSLVLKQADFGNAKVLLVEDNEINQEVASEMLKQLGLTFELVSNGEQAVNKLKEATFDLVLMDIQMPIMDGYQATKLIRQFNSFIPIVALTAAAMVEDRDKALLVGMNDHLSKPIEKSVLYAKLVHWLKPGTPMPLSPIETILVLETDRLRIKKIADAYQGKARLLVANQVEKANTILTQHPEIKQVMVSSQWPNLTDVVEALQKTFKVNIEIND
ncbi:PhnD/SsuA/transferrin family substrate-binding protein [Thiomicrorhabdus aquaedulcis]|uniref:PhnD/SsuA/transferrin family substrate-binding protein n=1 Tax=Thiomicrorhabdus aquaedulcis TaxID=2211106 RepID=UPI0015629276|nr:PhnD/SsuA/transferrin family substrate-binding protein [Thiomicrorhabdus aquaedulcis]